MPCNLNFVLEMLELINIDFVEPLLRWIDAPLKGYTSYFKLYYNFEIPLDLFPNLPFYQLEISQTVIQPFVSASKFGLLDLEYDVFLLADRVCNGKRLCKADNYLINFSRDEHFLVNNPVTSLDSVTELTICLDFNNPEALEQIPTVCPNIQRLSIINCGNFQRILEEFRLIALHCLDLRGLNLLDCPGEVKDYRMWELLSDMKLTHLFLETCCLFGINSDEQKLANFFQKCSSLQALQIEKASEINCEACQLTERKANWSLLSYFPALKYCRLRVYHLTVLPDVINSCKQLTILSCFGFSRAVPVLSACSCILQQISINERMLSIPDIFLETVSAHGGLVHVVLIVKSVSNLGITNLVRNSPKLLTCLISMNEFLTDDRDTIDNFKDNLQQMFPGRKLFSVGRFHLEISIHGFIYWDYIPGTDLFPLWWRH